MRHRLRRTHHRSYRCCRYLCRTFCITKSRGVGVRRLKSHPITTCQACGKQHTIPSAVFVVVPIQEKQLILRPASDVLSNGFDYGKQFCSFEITSVFVLRASWYKNDIVLTIDTWSATKRKTHTLKSTGVHTVVVQVSVFTLCFISATSYTTIWYTLSDCHDGRTSHSNIYNTTQPHYTLAS